MKHIVAAIILIAAAPAAAQTASPAQGHQGHDQQPGQHQQHGQHGPGQHAPQADCCADRNDNGVMDCCEGMAAGDRRGCCQEQGGQTPAAPQAHQGH